MPSVCCARANGLRAGGSGRAAKRAATCGAGEQRRGRDIARGVQRGARIERGKPFAQRIGRRGEIGLAQQQRVGQRRLAARLRMAIERRLAVQRIDHA